MNGASSPDIDARGWRCPRPVIALARAARDAEPGSRIGFLKATSPSNFKYNATCSADDPAARSDIPAWVRLKGYRVHVADEAQHTRYVITLSRSVADPTSS